MGARILLRWWPADDDITILSCTYILGRRLSCWRWDLSDACTDGIQKFIYGVRWICGAFVWSVLRFNAPLTGLGFETTKQNSYGISRYENEDWLRRRCILIDEIFKRLDRGLE
jgi:hypothetical protein